MFLRRPRRRALAFGRMRTSRRIASRRQQPPHPHQVVRRGRQLHLLPDLPASHVPRPPQAADHLRPAEEFLVLRRVEKPAEEHVRLQAATRFALRADRAERLEQERLQQPFGRDRRTAVERLGAAEVAVSPAQRLVDHALDRAQRVVPLDELLEVDGVPEAAVRFAVSAYDGRFARGAPAVFIAGIRGVFQRPAKASTRLRTLRAGTREQCRRRPRIPRAHRTPCCARGPPSGRVPTQTAADSASASS